MICTTRWYKLNFKGCVVYIYIYTGFSTVQYCLFYWWLVHHVAVFVCIFSVENSCDTVFKTLRVLVLQRYNYELYSNSSYERERPKPFLLLLGHRVVVGPTYLFTLCGLS